MTPARSPPQLLKHHADNTGLPVVVDFFSQSCGPCRMIAPAFKRLAQEYEGRVVFAKAENTAPGVFAAAGVRSMPTFHFYFDGKRRHEFAGADEGRMRLTKAVADETRARACA